MNSSTLTPLITEDHIRQYQEEGYFILEKVLDPETVENLRDFSGREIDRMHGLMDEQGTDVIGLNRRNSRYFIPHSYREDEAVYNYAFGDIMSQICQATIGQTANLFLDQWVIKAAEKGSTFSWHQDSGYIEFPHDPYVTCWTALDDVTEENGTVYLLPYSSIGIKTRVDHIKDPEVNDKVGYFGKDPGIPVIVPAGSVAVFSSVCFHRSGSNTTPNLRRVLLTQYSKDAIENPWTGKQSLNCIPFLKNGKKADPGFEAAKTIRFEDDGKFD
ncbi:phytanoyl-CoA dioxygenase family protein [Pelagicoccus enzymogenes]|uniref:phytanoyl-CoA dioxygenase family protein n=1 Tax=Pelagicoccus enzymogenes TaxID=2773457 RepID=UPI00280D4CA4|nr:phytanoyl-CoA dioxygenase family protein [Pelagicoccus enzymogenes]MDQ8197682.1 phytanoyl-CoA dioxygenase family protein [Pelagicoccus enzymogenes]